MKKWSLLNNHNSHIPLAGLSIMSYIRHILYKWQSFEMELLLSLPPLP